MKLIYKFLLINIMLIFINGCNSVDRFSILKQCTVLGDESIVYARAHYVQLFHHFNPEKFEVSYKQIDGFDNVTMKNTIDTYARAVQKIASIENKIDDPETKNLIAACEGLSIFSKDFVENSYPKAISHKSKNNPLTDDFFIEINQLVKFDHNIGSYDKNTNSFKRSIDIYKKAVSAYVQAYRKSIPTEFINKRNSKKGT